MLRRGGIVGTSSGRTIGFASDWAGPVTTVASSEANFDEPGGAGEE